MELKTRKRTGIVFVLVCLIFGFIVGVRSAKGASEVQATQAQQLQCRLNTRPDYIGCTRLQAARAEAGSLSETRIHYRENVWSQSVGWLDRHLSDHAKDVLRVEYNAMLRRYDARHKDDKVQANRVGMNKFLANASCPTRFGGAVAAWCLFDDKIVHRIDDGVGHVIEHCDTAVITVAVGGGVLYEFLGPEAYAQGIVSTAAGCAGGVMFDKLKSIWWP